MFNWLWICLLILFQKLGTFWSTEREKLSETPKPNLAMEPIIFIQENCFCLQLRWRELLTTIFNLSKYKTEKKESIRIALTFMDVLPQISWIHTFVLVQF